MSRPIKTSSAANKLAFFGLSPVSHSEVADPMAVTCTTGTFFTADFVTASTNAATAVALIADDVVNLQATLASVVDALQRIGLV